MLSVTRGELDALTVGTAVAVIAFVFVSAAGAWWKDREFRALRELVADVDADVDHLWAWCLAAAVALGWTDDDGQGPDDGDDPPPDDPDDGPPTVIAHPLDMWERQEALLARYTHIGTHRG